MRNSGQKHHIKSVIGWRGGLFLAVVSIKITNNVAMWSTSVFLGKKSSSERVPSCWRSLPQKESHRIVPSIAIRAYNGSKCISRHFPTPTGTVLFPWWGARTADSRNVERPLICLVRRCFAAKPSVRTMRRTLLDEFFPVGDEFRKSFFFGGTTTAGIFESAYKGGRPGDGSPGDVRHRAGERVHACPGDARHHDDGASTLVPVTRDIIMTAARPRRPGDARHHDPEESASTPSRDDDRT